jgi:hypothetical protein
VAVLLWQWRVKFFFCPPTARSFVQEFVARRRSLLPGGGGVRWPPHKIHFFLSLFLFFFSFPSLFFLPLFFFRRCLPRLLRRGPVVAPTTAPVGPSRPRLPRPRRRSRRPRPRYPLWRPRSRSIGPSRRSTPLTPRRVYGVCARGSREAAERARGPPRAGASSAGGCAQGAAGDAQGAAAQGKRPPGREGAARGRPPHSRCLARSRCRRGLAAQDEAQGLRGRGVRPRVLRGSAGRG